MAVLLLVIGLVLGAALGWLAASVRGASAAALDTRRLSDAFAGVSAEALDRQAGAGRVAVEGVVGPLRAQLDAVDVHLRSLEASRQHAYGDLTGVVRSLAAAQEQLRRETAGLVTALRAPSVRGSWGELQLRRVVELAGMLPHVDFTEQHTADGAQAGEGAGRLRPDLTVHLPGDGLLVVDSKVPLQGWLQCQAAADEGERRAAVAAHARQLRAHVDALAAKKYWTQFDRTPELVVLFVPGEPILSAALEAQPDLYEHALASSVLLATPTSLIGLLKTAAHGWRSADLAANAAAVCELGRTLHDRLGVVVDKVDTVGRRLGSTVAAYNEAVGSLESRVLVSARRFTELGVAGDELPTVRQVDAAPRRLSAVGE